MVHTISLKNVIRSAIVVAAFGSMSLAHAGFSAVLVNNGASLLSFPGTPINVSSAPVTVTVTGGTMSGGTGANITTIQMAGADAADFALVGGGTCAVGTILTPGQTCTQNVQFHPSAVGARTGMLQVACTAVGVIGGLTVTCGNGVGNMQNFAGNGLAALITQSVPAMDPKALTLMAGLLMLLGSYFGLRRKSK